jgi:glyoxylase-like metal-dependent hydrolase (beta-lactamase superfamily II)
LPDVDVLTVTFPIPGFGFLPINAFVLHADEPVLIDTGPTLDGEGKPLIDRFMAALADALDPADIRWIWLTHTDQDHVGALNHVLEAAPRARVVTTFVGAGKMTLFNPLPMDRVLLLNPGQRLDVGDRTLTAFKPPTYDAPETTGFFDHESGVLFSSDSFGALLSSPQADARDLSAEELRDGQILWATVDSPWLHQVGETAFARGLEAIKAFSPRAVFSSHLPPAFEMTERLIETLDAARGAPLFVGPDQQQLEAMLGEITDTPPPVVT